MILMNTEVGVCVVLGVAGRWRKYRWINAHHHCRYNLLFLSLPRPALTFSVIPQGWQLRLLIVIRLPAAKGNASRPYVCCCNIQLLTDYLTVARDCCVNCYYWRKMIVGD